MDDEGGSTRNRPPEDRRTYMNTYKTLETKDVTIDDVLTLEDGSSFEFTLKNGEAVRAIALGRRPRQGTSTNTSSRRTTSQGSSKGCRTSTKASTSMRRPAGGSIGKGRMGFHPISDRYLRTQSSRRPFCTICSMRPRLQ